MTKRQITPHKGGRSKRLYIRIKPALKSGLEQAAQQQEITVNDLVEKIVEIYLETQGKIEPGEGDEVS